MCTEIWTQYGWLKVCPKQTKLKWMRQVAPQHLRGQYQYDTCTSGSNKQTQKQQVNKTKQRNCAWNEKTNNIFALPWITSSYHSCKHVAKILQLLLVEPSSRRPLQLYANIQAACSPTCLMKILTDCRQWRNLELLDTSTVICICKKSLPIILKLQESN